MKYLQQTEIAPGYVIFEINHPNCSARVANHGAHLMEWHPKDEDPVIYLSPEAVYRKGKAIRGGIPICWPWFADHPTDPTKPAHGFARTRIWQLEDARESEDEVSLRFVLEDDAETRKCWPFSFRLELEIRLGRELELTLIAHNSGDVPFHAGGAFHAYFAVADSRRATVSGLDMSVPLGISSEVEAFFPSAADATLQDADREILVEKSSLPAAMIWNPWIEKSMRLGDLPNDDYLKFICIEPLIPNSDAVEIAPGSSHRISTIIRVSPLETP